MLEKMKIFIRCLGERKEGRNEVRACNFMRLPSEDGHNLALSTLVK